MAYFKYQNKNIYFEEIGSGEPLLLLHGNTASSKMFDCIIDLYKHDFTLIRLDFLGHGKSDRLEEFPADFWFDEAMQVKELLNTGKYKNLNIMGTSGGALAALNAALECDDCVNKVIADSFEGEEALALVTENIGDERRQSKSVQEAVGFWEYNHGSDWESVVDNDTNMIMKHYQSVKKFFHKDLSQLRVPVMLTASLEDEYAPYADFDKTYNAMLTKIPKGKLHFFPTGGHPAMLSNAVEFFNIAKKFFMEE